MAPFIEARAASMIKHPGIIEIINCTIYIYKFMSRLWSQLK